MDKLRVWALYRVSTTKQLGAEDDIPTQEAEVRRMIANHRDWTLVRELYEKGVSGFKKRLDERDVIQEIISAAEQGQFDVLAVFAHDRIGRNKDEIPPMVTYLIKVCGIQIWSSTDGEMQAKTHVDALINYIHLWRAEGESRKISERVIPAIRLKNEEGKYAGGKPPYGYEIYNTGEINPKKDKFIKEYRILEREMEVVRLMFELSDKKGWGCNRIANHLNKLGYRTREGKVWRFNTIHRILQHPIYIGYRRYGQVKEGTLIRLPKEEWKLQPKNESLVAIDEDQWHRVQDLIAKRSTKDIDKVSYAQRGKLLLNGIARCGYCGNVLRMHYEYSKYNSVKGEVKEYISLKYKCHSGQNELDTHEQFRWGAKKFEKLVHDAVLQVIREMNLEDLTKEMNKNQERALLEKEKELRKLNENREKIKRGLDVLHEEVVKVLIGESKFTEDTLNAAIKKSETDLNKIDEEISEVQKDIETRKGESNQINTLRKEVIDWEERYNRGDLDEKKVMLSRLIDAVYFKKDELDLRWKFDLDSLQISV